MRPMLGWRASLVPLGVSFGLALACAGRPTADAEHGVDDAALSLEADTGVARLDAELARSWDAAGIEPSPLASDSEFLRRASLDLRGRAPTRGEVEGFLADTRADKRAALVDELLASEDFAAHWASLWAARLLPGDKKAERLASEPLERYLAEALAENRPWDRVVDELLAGEGELRDDPALAFLASRPLRGQNKQDALAELSATTSRVFLGSRIECAQCHDHPYVAEFSREDFWAQTAYFGRTVVSLERRGEDGQKGRPKLEILERGRGELRVALGAEDDPRKRPIAPRFMGAEDDPLAPEADRRGALADAIVEDPRFAEATAGWVWTVLLGRGIVEPWDDLLDPRARPELLTLLAAEFRASDHDLRELLRTIALSSAYQRSSSDPGGEAQTPVEIAKAEAAFARASVRPLSAKQLFASLMTVTEVDRIEGRGFRRAVRQREQAALREYEFVFGDDEMRSSEAFSGNVPQALLLLNGALTNQAVVARPGSALDRVLGDSDDTDARLRELWLTVYARDPSSAELEIGREAVADDRRADWEDLMFAMLYSSEFSSNH